MTSPESQLIAPDVFTAAHTLPNPPFSYRWEPGEAAGEDMRFKAHGVAPKSAADFASCCTGFTT